VGNLYIGIPLVINKYKEKLVILQLIGIMAIKRKETRMIAYICRFLMGI